MIPLWTWIVGGAAAAGAFWTGFQAGEARGEQAHAHEITRLRQASEKVIGAKIAELSTTATERNQCRGEVDKVNAAAGEQARRLQALLSSDVRARAEAIAKMEAAAAEAAEQVRLFNERVVSAREQIEHVEDKCAGAGVPADVLRVLDDLLTPVALP